MPWLPEAHERATIEPVPPARPRLRDRARHRLHRLLHPHAVLLARLEQLAVTICPFCETVNPDPTDNCPRCGL